jgi:hypothetical protein
VQGLPSREEQAREVTLACALKLGGDFNADHAAWLARQVPGLVCVTDEEVPGVPTVKPELDLPGWWIKMNMFSPSVLRGDVLMMDLDTVVLSMPALPDRSTVLEDFSWPGLIGSGFMFVTAADRARIWADFTRDPQAVIATHKKWPKHGDQGYLFQHLGAAQRWQSVAKVYSFKTHCEARLPTDAQVVCFHGKPRPWEVERSWVPKLH